MNKNIIKLFIAAMLVVGCRRNPIERLSDPVPDGSVPQSSGIFIIYDDELKTGGGLALIPAGENQTIDLKNFEDPRPSRSQIKYVWNGQPVSGQQLFAGFSLLITPDGTTLSATPAKNLSSPGYTTLKMKIRGTLGAENRLRIEGPSDGSSTPARMEIAATSLSTAWQDVTLAIPAGDFNAVKIFATFSVQYDQPPRTTAAGTGGAIFIDDLRYEK